MGESLRMCPCPWGALRITCCGHGFGLQGQFLGHVMLHPIWLRVDTRVICYSIKKPMTWLSCSSPQSSGSCNSFNCSGYSKNLMMMIMISSCHREQKAESTCMCTKSTLHRSWYILFTWDLFCSTVRAAWARWFRPVYRRSIWANALAAAFCKAQTVCLQHTQLSNRRVPNRCNPSKGNFRVLWGTGTKYCHIQTTEIMKCWSSRYFKWSDSNHCLADPKCQYYTDTKPIWCIHVRETLHISTP